MDAVSTVVGLVGTAIQLEKELQEAIERYCYAHETAESLRVFGLNLNADKLFWIQMLIQKQKANLKLNIRAVQNLDKAVRALNGELGTSKAYFEGRTPNRTIPRAWWALHTESKVRTVQENLQKQLDHVAGFLQLVHTTSRETPQPLDTETFNFGGRPRPKKVLSGLKWSRAHYHPEDSKLVENYNADVDVLLERLPYSEDKLKQSSRFKDAGQLVRHLQEISEARPNARYYTRLLLCIGYKSNSDEPQDLIYLLPKNASLAAQPPMSLQKAIVHSRGADSSITVTLETRFNIALQLARALLATHTAGFSNCSIRSDKILFIQRLQDEEPVEKVNNAALEDRSPPPPEAKLERQSTFRRGANQVRRTFTFFGRAEQSVAKQETAKGNKEPKKKTSRTNLRSVKSFRWRGKEDEKRVPDISADSPPSAEHSSSNWPGSSVLEVGSIPPGVSVFLAYWQYMRDHTAGPRAWRKEWQQNLYRHPSLQEAEPIRFSAGHDIYALGVCLLEIGLWDALVWEDSGVFHISEILTKRLETRPGKKNKVLEKLTKKSKVAKDQESLAKKTEEPEVQEDPTKKTEEAGILEALLKKTGGPEKVRQTLIDIAASELPKLMGKRYATVVQACLECMDGQYEKYWDIDFRNPEFGRRHLEYRKRVCDAIDTILVSMLSSLSTSISGEGLHLSSHSFSPT